ncbi:unconventional myosin-XIX [Protopterus annectens]|uniref:unconventional myosin-XIX n=1 Tax=Protopterus annectens TaxID=7888 RepID=UPI001CF9D034|nr:unconventional myosin-XIX [Protopterus annectens]
MKCASEEERLVWDMPKDSHFFWLPNADVSLEEDSFDLTKDAMLHLGINHDVQNQIFRILAGLLHLGNLQFVDPVNECHPCKPCQENKDFLRSASCLLMVSQEELVEQLQFRTITAGRQQHVFMKPCSKAECGTRKDCLAKVIYARLFDWLMQLINRSICTAPSNWTNFIGLLDVYGFESFPVNNLEQLCINYANEKLQQHFVAHYLRAQQEEYVDEGLAWSFVSYQDNRSCLDLIEGGPISIFSLLNEECRLNRASDATQLQIRIENALSVNPCIGMDKFNKIPNFIVSHYAGQVSYHLVNMVEKNKDPVPPELIGVLQKSQDSLIQQLFPFVQEDLSNGRAHNRNTVVTVVSKFKVSLENLMQILNGTSPHYIRCIKPNMDCKPMTLRKDEVLRQLEACGIVETIHISAAGFPIRISYDNFIERYGIIGISRQSYFGTLTMCGGPSAKRRKGLDNLSSDLEAQCFITNDILEAISPWTNLISSYYDPAETQSSGCLVHCGKTKIFTTHSVLEFLESVRRRRFTRAAYAIQYCWKRYKSQKLKKQSNAAVIIQAAFRSWVTRKHILRMHIAAAVLQKAWKKWRAKMDTLAAAELDDTEGDSECQTSILHSPIQSNTSSPMTFCSPPSCKSLLRLQVPEYTRLKSWPIGLIFSFTPNIKLSLEVNGFLKVLSLLACFDALGQNLGYRVHTNQLNTGIVSIRALPQGLVKFRCKRSPLLYASTFPLQQTEITGFNQILLEKI